MRLSSLAVGLCALVATAALLGVAAAVPEVNVDVAVDLDKVEQGAFHLDRFLRPQAAAGTEDAPAMAEVEATVRVHQRTAEKEEDWFHLDALIAEQEKAGTHAQAHTTHGHRAHHRARHHSRQRAQQREEDEDALAPSKDDNSIKSEQEKDVRDRKGGSTSVIANKNFMSIMEDEEGKDLDPKAAAEEARLEAEEAAHKRDGEHLHKRRSEQSMKKDNDQENRKAAEEKSKAADVAADSAAKEVEEAQKKAEAVNRKNLENEQKQKEDKKKAVREEQMANQLVLADGWTYLNEGYAVGRVDKVGDVCFGSGVLKGRYGYIGQVAKKCAPGRRVMFALKTAQGHQVARIDIVADGRVYYVAGPESTWLSLSGMTYPVANAAALTLSGSWQNYGGGWTDAAIRVENGMCVLSGLIRDGDWNKFAKVSQACVPTSRLVFNGCNHLKITRIDLTGDGDVLYSAGAREHGWVSLNNIIYVPDDKTGTELTLKQGWSNFGGQFRRAMFHKAGEVCVLSGVIKNPAMSTDIAELPAGCRPDKRIIFSVNSFDKSARVDVLPDGSLKFVNNNGAEWISLAGIAFVIAK